MDTVPMGDSHEAIFNIKIGDRSSRKLIPNFRDQPVSFLVSEGLDVLRAKLERHTTQLVESWNSDRKNKDILIFNNDVEVVAMTGHQPSNSVPKQTSWMALNVIDFIGQLQNIWNKVAAATPIPNSMKKTIQKLL
jgi:hypothetical protein